MDSCSVGSNRVRIFRPVHGRSKEGRGASALALCLLLGLLGGCVSARDCAGDIPEELRADALRMLLDRKLLRIDEMPEADRELALSRGRPEAEIPEELRAAVTTQALGYRHCVQSRTRQGR